MPPSSSAGRRWSKPRASSCSERGSDMKAEMQLTILEDGTISIQTGNMAGEHHASADEFIKLVHQLHAATDQPPLHRRKRMVSPSTLLLTQIIASKNCACSR